MILYKLAILGNMALVFSPFASATEPQVICYHDAVTAITPDFDAYKGTDRADKIIAHAVILCNGAKDRAPIRCYNEAMATLKQTYDGYLPYVPAGVAIQLCGAPKR